MNTWVLLLRGINVGGHRKIPMKQLSEALAEGGFESVRTYIQSGNVVVKSGEDRDAVRASAASAIEQTFGFHVPIVVRSPDELTTVANVHPNDTGTIDVKLLHVVFLHQAPAASARLQLDSLATQYAPDMWWHSPTGMELFVAYPDGSGRSRFTLDVMERHLGVVGTARNLNTVRRLLEVTAA